MDGLYDWTSSCFVFNDSKGTLIDYIRPVEVIISHEDVLFMRDFGRRATSGKDSEPSHYNTQGLYFSPEDAIFINTQAANAFCNFELRSCPLSSKNV